MKRAKERFYTAEELRLSQAAILWEAARIAEGAQFTSQPGICKQILAIPTDQSSLDRYDAGWIAQIDKLDAAICKLKAQTAAMLEKAVALTEQLCDCADRQFNGRARELGNELRELLVVSTKRP